MDNKCKKYEGLFVFSTDEELQKHIAECEECRMEHEKMEKVSSLLDEVKLYYHSKRKQKRVRLRAACAVVFMFMSLASLGIFAVNDDFTETLMYGSTLTAEDYGFPVDSYGLLMVDE